MRIFDQEACSIDLNAASQHGWAMGEVRDKKWQINEGRIFENHNGGSCRKSAKNRVFLKPICPYARAKYRLLRNFGAPKFFKKYSR